MKKLLAVFILFTSVLSGQNFNGRISSSFYTFNRFNSLTDSKTYLRSYNTLSFNLTKNNVSLRTRLNLESDIVNPLDNDPRLRFYNLFIEARKIFNIATIKVGRQPIYNSVAGGLFDGVNLKLKHKGFSLVGYYGANVPAYQKLELTDDWGNDYILGGTISANFLQHFRVALSYINKNFKPVEYTALRLDENLNPIQILIQKNSNQYKFVSGDFSYRLKNVVRVNTRYDYDLNFNTTSKFYISARYSQIKNLGISLYYNYREPRIRYNSILSVFNFGNTKEIEGGIDYKINNQFTVIGKFGNVSYKDDNSQRLTLGINSNFGNLSYRKTFGYAGELSSISAYAAHTFFNGLLTPSIGLAYTSYKLSEDAETNNITSLLGGINFRPLRLWSFDLQGQFFNNKFYKDDFRLLFKINYWFNTNFN